MKAHYLLLLSVFCAVVGLLGPACDAPTATEGPTPTVECPTIQSNYAVLSCAGDFSICVLCEAHVPCISFYPNEVCR